MMANEGSRFIKYSLSIWYIVFCLLLVLSLIDALKVNAIYISNKQSRVAGTEIETLEKGHFSTISSRGVPISIGAMRDLVEQCETGGTKRDFQHTQIIKAEKTQDTAMNESESSVAVECLKKA